MLIKIFYSWQSDIRFNNNAIKDALNKAIVEIGKDEKGPIVKLFDSTSNLVGSTRIPESILKDISACDIFVCDLTIIGKSENRERSIPNPNVLLELGYAIAVLGWHRTIVVFNDKYGVITDLPFDIEKRSVLTCSIENKDDSNGIGMLKSKLREWIKRIIDQNPVRGIVTTLKHDVIKRKRDITTLRKILEYFVIDEIDEFFEAGVLEIRTSFIDNWNGLLKYLGSKSFFLYDQDAKEVLLELRNTDVIMHQLLMGYEKNGIFFTSPNY